MKEPIFRSDMTVELVDHMGDDHSMVRAARVSSGTHVGERDENADAGLIRFLMKNRHGSPFEQNAITYYIETPLFVAREFMRHRVASYNETSGRYREMEPVFYVPNRDRELVQHGKVGHYMFRAGDEDQREAVRASLSYIAAEAFGEYEVLLAQGVAKEVARMVLPLNLYTSFFVTMNMRGLMNFLSLRTRTDNSFYPSYPQREIELVAEQMEEMFASLFPLTYTAWDDCGRVCP